MPRSGSPRRPRAGSRRGPGSTWTRRFDAPVSSTDPVAERSYDIVVFGATGFTGALTAEYLAANAPDGLRWALAGRSLEKLEQVRRQLGGQWAELPLLRADVTDAGSVRDVAEATRVVITTVGPYIRYGEPLVAACAAAGTDYVDLTGEPEFVDRMWLGYHAQAVESGARL
ncbi:MAG: saccharopine dehydrogenase NADP-binding domain-containing protein, partial [Solirubrobacterales bacterium]|nr:saccharopine dehydrogenase NADP-binding domain-containing protein [Solirubrobacterales bacterium]